MSLNKFGLIAKVLKNYNELNLIGSKIRLLSTKSKVKVQPESSNHHSRLDSQSFVMNLFLGEGRLGQQFPFPKVLNQEEIQMVDMINEPLARGNKDLIDPLKFDQNEQFDDKLWNTLKDLGSFGTIIPPEYGGAGLKASQYALLSHAIGQHDLSLCVALGAHQSIGLKGIIMFGTEEQKQKYLPDLATGKKIACFCLTEPAAGSDASGIKSRAEPSPDGKHFILNGSKIWISNGGIADIFTVFAKTPYKDADGKVTDKVTAFIVERAFDGVTTGKPEKKMGIKASNTADIFFENVKVPVENVLGEVGNGFKIAMNILNNGRFGMVGALTGTMKTCIERTVEHVNTRNQFGNKLATYGSIQEKIARMSMLHYTTESMAFMLSGIMDQGFNDFQLEAAISKIYASESAWFVVDETLQTLGGMGYMKEAGIEKIMRDVRVFRIFEGTNDILRLFVALTGVQYAGGHLKELQRAMQNPVANLGMIFGEGTKRMKRAVGLSSGPSLSEYVHPQLRDNASMVSKSIENFGASVEYLLIKYNKNIVNEQFLLKRLADSAIDIYAMIVILSRASRALKLNLPSAQHEVSMTNVICNEKATKIVENLSSIRASDKLKNFSMMKLISNEVCKNGGVIQEHPLN